MSKCDTCKHCKKAFALFGKKFCVFDRWFYDKPEASTCIFYDSRIRKVKR